MSMNYALITGCSKGLGKALAKQLLTMDYVVFPVVRHERSLGKWAGNRDGTCFPILADVSMDHCADIIRAELAIHCPKLDLLINNAGIPGVEPSLEKATPAEHLALFNVHCLGALRV